MSDQENKLRPGTVMWIKQDNNRAFLPSAFTECKVISQNEDGTYHVVSVDGMVLDFSLEYLVSKEELPFQSAITVFHYKGEDYPEFKLFKGAPFYFINNFVYSPVLEIYFESDYFHIKLRHLFDVIPRTSHKAQAGRKPPRPSDLSGI